MADATDHQLKVFVLTCFCLGLVVAICDQVCTKGYQCVGTNICVANHQANLCNWLSPDLDDNCTQWRDQGLCLAYPEMMWYQCQTSCSKYSTCECDVIQGNPSDRNCSCGEYAMMGLCESDPDIATNCSYTCGKRSDPANYCSPVPLTSLADNSEWKLSSPPPVDDFGSNSAYLQTATMVCKHGYKAQVSSNSATHICDPFTFNITTKNWRRMYASPEPVCLKLQCPEPPTVEYGKMLNYTDLEGFYFGDQVTLECNPGYSMTGSTSPNASCTFNTQSAWQWDNGNPQCVCKCCLVLSRFRVSFLIKKFAIDTY